MKHGLTADDLPTTIPDAVKLQALNLLRSSQYFVYVGSRKAPARIRNQWLVTTLGVGHDGPELGVNPRTGPRAKSNSAGRMR
jgi:hypothetical protein